MTLTEQLMAISPVLYLLITAFIILAIDIFVSKTHKIKAFYPLLCYVAIVLSGGTLLNSFSNQTAESAPLFVFSNSLVLDNLYRIASLFILSVLTLLVFFTHPYLKKLEVQFGEFYALLLCAVSGMMLVTASNEFITLFFSLEIFSIATYILTGYTRESTRTTEAAMKYFIVGAFATSFILYGMTLLYGVSGSIYLHKIAGSIDKNIPLAMVGMVLMLIGLAFKIGAIPFHMWVPDVYEGAPTAVTAFMSVTVKTAGFAVLVRLIWTIFADFQFMAEVLMGISAITMVVGNLFALTQKSVKRMLAYSSIAHTGYALVGLTIFTATKDPQAVSATLYYLLTYSFMTVGAFVFIIYATKNNQEAELYEHFAGLAKQRPWAAFAMTIFMLSLAGIPPTGGFFSKFYLFQNAIQHQYYGLVIIGIFATMLSLYYYLKVIVMMYMQEPSDIEELLEEEKPYFGLHLTIFATAILTLILGLVPSRFLEFIGQWSVGVLS